MEITTNIAPYLKSIRHLEPHSHKGQNGKVLLIGGSELFHAASRWSLDVLASMVDMVFYSSVPANNELIREAKGQFWDGVVVPRGEVENYLTEANVILIGPGMERNESSNLKSQIANLHLKTNNPSLAEWNQDTEKIINYLLAKNPDKKWVIDAGALQMMDPKLLNKNCIITPHPQELERVLQKLKSQISNLLEMGSTVLLKGEIDTVMQGSRKQEVAGGNAGMTKGGTGDALAGLVAGLYVFTNDPFAAAVVGSFINKTAGDKLYKEVGPFFKTTDLVKEIPKVLKEVLGY